MRVSLFGLKSKDITYKEYSNYPPVLRDLSVVVDNSVKEEEIENAICSVKTDNLLRKLRLYDIYRMDGGKTSYTFSLEFRAEDKTLTNDEVNKYQDKIINALKKNIKAELRS
jgi:phenylalanyl-tRNA synthetase beta chain